MVVCPKAGLGVLDCPNAGAGVLVWPKAGLAAGAAPPNADGAPPEDDPKAEVVVPLPLAPKADCPNAEPLAGGVDAEPNADPVDGDAPKPDDGLLATAPKADDPNADGVDV